FVFAAATQKFVIKQHLPSFVPLFPSLHPSQPPEQYLPSRNPSATTQPGIPKSRYNVDVK
ncbi:MAG: hypothetical protein ACNYVW_08440, partial [Methanosarcinales archaeon]